MGVAAVVLVVVWFGAGAATNYQLAFPTAALCQQARHAVLDDATRVQKEFGPNPAPVVSAVCVFQSEVKR